MRNQQVIHYPERWLAKPLQSILRYLLTDHEATIPLNSSRIAYHRYVIRLKATAFDKEQGF